MKKILLFSTAVFLLFTNCSDNKSTDWYTFAETLSANPWELDSRHTDREVVDAAESYLCDDLDMKVKEITIDGALGGTCFLSSCPSGRTISVKIKGDDNDRAVLLSKGFQDM